MRPQDRIYRGKQAFAATLGDRDGVDYHIYYGPVRSGKTESGLVGFLEWSRNFRGDNFLLAEPTEAQLRYNLERVFRWYAGENLKPVEKAFEAFGNTYLRYSANAEGAEKKILGFSLRGAFLDEAAVMPRSFVNEVTGRCDKSDIKIIMTMNPEGPKHWLKREYIDDTKKDPTYEVLRFSIDDNPSLTRAFKRRLKRTYKGVWLQRKYYGRWAAATGAIYPEFHIGTPPNEAADKYVSIDHARSSVTHAVQFNRYLDGTHWAVNEWRHNGQEQGQLSADQQAKKVLIELVPHDCIGIVVDPQAMDFIEALRDNTDIPVVAGINTVDVGIQQTQLWIEHKKLRISNDCPFLIDDLSNYEWDENWANLGQDKPKKEDDHGADLTRYYTMARTHGQFTSEEVLNNVA